MSPLRFRSPESPFDPSCDASDPAKAPVEAARTGVGIEADAVASKHHYGLTADCAAAPVGAVPDTSGGMASAFPTNRAELGRQTDPGLTYPDII
jgi:hypothetical protein